MRHDRFTTQLLTNVDRIIARDRSAESRLHDVCTALAARLPGYDWVGFYIVDPRHPRELILGPFAGEETEHVRIPFGSGVCGHVADVDHTVIVDDVRARQNYLSCSIAVRSEIVIPVRWQGKFIGELDIDSHTEGRFTAEDRALLEAVAARVASTVEDYRGNLEADCHE